MPDLINLDLGRFDVNADLFNLRSPWESGQLVEDNDEVGAWHLLHRVVTHYVELLVEVAANVRWAIWIPVSRASGFFIPATLAIGVLHHASIALASGFAILGDAIMANMKDLTPNPGGKGGS
jgi:hypothetical protein